MKKLAILILFAAVSCLQADEPVTRVLQLKYANPNALATVLRPYGAVNADNQLRAISITVRDGALMSEVEKVVARLDVPPPAVPNIDVTIYLMSARPAPSAGAIPPELDPVVRQLKNTFSYKGYELIDTEVMRVRAGQGGSVSGVVNGAPSVEGNKTISQVGFRSA